MKKPNRFQHYYSFFRFSSLLAQQTVLLIFSLLVATSVSSSTDVVGKVLLIKGLVIADSVGKKQTQLVKGSEVYEQDTIQTAKDGYLVIKMTDDTKITLRPNSKMTLDEFNADPGRESVAIGLLKGGLRTITGSIGKISPETFQVNTPTTTIGIRGTDFVARICEDGGSSTQCSNQCGLEESQLSDYQRLASKPGSINGKPVTEQTLSECKPMTGIENGLYLGLYDGKLNVDHNGNEIDIEALTAARVTGSAPECLVDVPNFLALDPYLGRYSENAIDLLKIENDLNELTSRVKKLLDTGFSPEVIYSNEASRGNALYTVVDAAVAADPFREPEFRWIADQVLGGMPDTACGCVNFERKREWKEISYDALEPKTVEEAARVYFEDGFHLSRLIENSSHGLFPVRELIGLFDEQKLWYRVLPVRNHPLPPGVYVSIYEDEEQIIVDGNLGMVLGALNRGDEYMPVIFQYYHEGHIPISRYPEQIASSEVEEILNDDDIWVSPPPDWLSGDFHAYMTIEEIENLAEIPEKEDVEKELWDEIYADLSENGFLLPVILSKDGEWDIEVSNSIERVSVAKELGIPLIPIAIFEPPPFPNHSSSCRRIIREGEYRFPGNAGGPYREASPVPIPPVIPPPPVSP
jgi:hypothetical protein